MSFYGLTKTTYPDSEYEEYEYDDMGNITTFTDCKGNDTVYTYDSMYRLTEIEYQDQSTVTFTYDLNSNRTKMEDDAPNTGDYVEYSYDTWDRLTTETRHISTSTYTVSYERDVADRLTKLTYTDNMQILYSYDDLNRITEIKRYIDGVNDEIIMDNVNYDTESLLTQFDYGNDLQAVFTYDSKDRLSTLDIKNGSTSYLDLDYTYDTINNVTQLINGWRDTDFDWHSETESYSYDGLDRLISVYCTSWSHMYAYDRTGNRTSKDSVTYTTNTVNEVTALSDGTSFTYDDNGNRTQKTKGTETWAYTYDFADRLTKVEKNSAILGEYIYDGDGKRLQVTENNVTTTYIYSGLSVLHEENTIGTADYIYGPKGLLTKRTTVNQESNTFYCHADHLGSNRLVTDENKNIVAAVTYHPFGESCVEEGSEHYLFTGKEKDTTGLYYYGARYYDPEVGRFLTRDPLKGELPKPQRLNRYTYCQNNPLKLIDLWGEKDFYIDGGGEQEEPEVIGDPSYDGHGQITVPTSMGDVTIDLDTDEDWGDVDDKAKQNEIKEKIKERNRAYEQKRREENRNTRKKYSLMGMGGNPEMECDGCDTYGAKGMTAVLAAAGGGLLVIAGGIIYGAANGSAVLLLVGVGVGTLGLGLLVIGIALAVYYAMKWIECESGSS
jgi:RHS repeat-associated protein